MKHKWYNRIDVVISRIRNDLAPQSSSLSGSPKQSEERELNNPGRRAYPIDRNRWSENQSISIDKISSLLHSCYQCRQATLDTNNGCVADYKIS